MKQENHDRSGLFSLQFDPAQIPVLAARYPAQEDHQVEMVIAPQARARQYFTRDEFLALCRWKTPRSRPRVAKNSAEYIQAVTQTALTTPDERLRIEVLTLLDGVSWPTASVLLHFGHHEPYPILDTRALEALGVEARQVDYDFEFWRQYTAFCRRLAAESGVDMRTLDRALWWYSKSLNSPASSLGNVQ